MHIAIVDYGMGNLRSVSQALHHVALDCKISIANDAQEILRSDRVVLPGQGAMPDCMAQLRSSGLLDAVLSSAREKPLLGICVGEQMLFEESEERKPGVATNTACLALMPGKVVRFALSGTQEDGSEYKIPHGLEPGPSRPRSSFMAWHTRYEQFLFCSQLLCKSQ